MSNVNRPGNRGKRKNHAPESGNSPAAGEPIAPAAPEIADRYSNAHGFDIIVVGDYHVEVKGEKYSDFLDLAQRTYTQSLMIPHAEAAALAFRAGWRSALVAFRDYIAAEGGTR